MKYQGVKASAVREDSEEEEEEEEDGATYEDPFAAIDDL